MNINYWAVSWQKFRSISYIVDGLCTVLLPKAFANRTNMLAINVGDDIGQQVGTVSTLEITEITSVFSSDLSLGFAYCL